MNVLLQTRNGSLKVDDLKRFLSDHSGYPASICRHGVESGTVASLIAEPAEGRLHVALTHPCEHPCTSYSFS